MTSPVVALRDVEKGYQTSQGPIRVLEGVDLEIEAGEKVSLIGPSGSGKSTLLSLISGLLRPDRGVVELDGTPLGELDDDERAALRADRVGIALQSDNLIPFLTARENIELAMGFGHGRNGNDQRALELLDRLGLAERIDHYPRQLSGGEAQRVALAVALANRPGVLLADEMVSALDAKTASDVVADLFSADLAVLFVTHHLELADRADRRLRLTGHRVVQR